MDNQVDEMRLHNHTLQKFRDKKIRFTEKWNFDIFTHDFS